MTPERSASTPDPQETAREIARAVAGWGGRAFMVGGCVRDRLLGLDVHDVDVEVYGIEPRALIDRLADRWRLDLVGAAFGVIRLHGQPVDVSVPRRDSRAPRRDDGRANAHRDFVVTADPHMSVDEAVQRRDFTINAILLDPLTGEIVDPAGGRADLEARLLRHVSDAHFADDPLRVLRGMQLVARFDLEPDPRTVALCRRMRLDDLSPERVYEEWRKLLVLGRGIGRGLEFLRATGHVDDYPELAATVGCPQDPRWHPEGDVWTHTLHGLDFFARDRTGDAYEDLVVGFAVLLHDVGKARVTRRDEDGRIRSPRHAEQSVELARAFLARMRAPSRVVDDVLPLVRWHASPRELHDQGAGDAAIRRLARRVGRIDRVARVCLADAMGRPPRSNEATERAVHDWILERARALEVIDRAPEPLLRGRDVLVLGVAPGPRVGEVLRECYEAQLDGEITTHAEAVAFARRWLDEHPAR